MVEMTLYGRGGQGGVTLAKLIATVFFRRGAYVQAFGVYAAERSGAPVQAFVRISDAEITNHNQVKTPDHVIVLDRTLISSAIVEGLKPGGWILLNTPEPPGAFKALLPGRRVACVDATSIAVEERLGTRAVPIVNTTLLGAAARMFDVPVEEAIAALANLRFGESNVRAARRAFDAVRQETLPGATASPPQRTAAAPRDVLDDAVGEAPRLRTGSWASRQPHRRTLTPPCNRGCPAGNEVRGFVEAIQRGDPTAALDVLLETTPLPGVCGRVCPAPCMNACNRRLFDEAVNIRDLERYAADHGTRPPAVRPWRAETVAVVGSGPAGLSATYYLARLGYPVTLIEAGAELGGLLRTGIPEYRLPRDVLDEEIRHILDHGVTVCHERVTLASLAELTTRFAAVFVGSGLQAEERIDLGEGGDGVVLSGLTFLDEARRGGIRLDGEHVLVVGGGNTAVDAARTAIRVGAGDVRIVYRRTRAEMPAIGEEIDEALEEGVRIEELAAPVRIRRAGDAALLTCRRMRLGEPGADGRRGVVPDVSEDGYFDLRGDRVILALGQSADLRILPEGSQIREGAALVGFASAPVFLGGDFATNEGTVAAAIGSGRRAALHLHRALTGEDLFPPEPAPVATPEHVTMHIFMPAPGAHGRVTPASERRNPFTEVRRGLPDDPVFHVAEDEAARCFSCGVCNQCDRCVQYCPEGVLVRRGEEFFFDYGQCKGCGVCASVCPRGVVYLTEL
ncbi:MAG: 2-oxoacid:acceptor oxidoreductase family protein [Phycisphaerae bacterium]|nr:2-oxoacid:acceptor oxidoreductase family protein [Phycisphaerae bacterium]